MKSPTESHIISAETQWLDLFERNARNQFAGVFLPSHDHTHHRRVWNLGKRLLREGGTEVPAAGYDLVEGVMVASWFHDLGMARTTSEKHGAIGSEVCHEFFLQHPGQEPVRLPEIMEAIALHDSKDETIYRGQDGSTSPSVLSLLSIADDLEALGTIGIYRYSEIYLERGIPLTGLGTRVLENANRRYRNLSSGREGRGVIRSFEGEWKELAAFFEMLQNQAASADRPEEVASGPLGVIRHIRIAGMERKVRPELLLEALTAGDTENGVAADPFVIRYFKRLKNELEKARC